VVEIQSFEAFGNRPVYLQAGPDRPLPKVDIIAFVMGGRTDESASRLRKPQQDVESSGEVVDEKRKTYHLTR
jgi:hypothetical protein